MSRPSRYARDVHPLFRTTRPISKSARTPSSRGASVSNRSEIERMCALRPSVGASSAFSMEERLTLKENAMYDELDKRVMSRRTSLPFPPHTYLPHCNRNRIGNCAPLGLLGFAVASLVTGILKIYPHAEAQQDGVFFVTALLLGGLAQLIAAVCDLINCNTHSATAFGVYGLHWIGTGMRLAVSSLHDYSFSEKPQFTSNAAYSAVFTVVTSVLLIPTLRMNRMMTGLLGALWFVFVLEVPAASGDIYWAEVASGVFQCIAGAFGLYLATVDLVNEAWNRPVMTAFPVRAATDNVITKIPAQSNRASLTSQRTSLFSRLSSADEKV